VGTNLPRVSARRYYIRVPALDWPKLISGHKTELRLTGRGVLVTTLQPPSGMIGYLRTPAGDRFRLFVCEDAWAEPLGAISDESLAREGFATRKEFRHYWRGRTHSHVFKPLTTVQVVRLRPFGPGDRELLGNKLFDRLWGPYADAQ
jgi:hypothetical protein